jgi:large subunit ribosomal protein L15
MKLHQISGGLGSSKNRKRVGRGPGSGLGKTGGRGIKGQTSRSGVAIKGFEGGQMPIHMRMPKRGFNPINKVLFNIVSLYDIEQAVLSGKLDPSVKLNSQEFRKAGLISKRDRPTKILGGSNLSKPLNFENVVVSKSALDTIHSCGGKVFLSDNT